MSSARIDRATLVDELLSVVRNGGSRIIEGERGAGRSWIANTLVRRLAIDGSARLLLPTRLAAAIPFGAFLPLVLEDDTRDLSLVPLDTLRAVAARLISGGTALVIDDAHLLDAASAGLVVELCQASVPMVLLVESRRGFSSPSEIVEMVHAVELISGVGRILLTPLTRRDLANLIAAELGGAKPADALVTAVSRHSGDLPLFARAAVALFRDSSRLSVRDGLAILTMRSRSLRDAATREASSTVNLMFERFDAGAIHVARLAAIGGALPEPLLRRLCGANALINAEAAGLVSVISSDGGGAMVAPRYAAVRDALVDGIPSSERLVLLQSLIDELADPDGAYIVPRTRWRLELGEDVATGAVFVAAEHAQQESSPDRDVLLDALLSRTLPASHRLRLASLLVRGQRLVEAEEILYELRRTQLPSPLARHRDLLRALLLALPGNEPTAAAHILQSLSSDDPLVKAYQAMVCLRLGDIGRASREADIILGAQPDGEARAYAALVLSACLVQAGPAGAYERLRRRREAVLEGAMADIPDPTELGIFLDEVALLDLHETPAGAEALARLSIERTLALDEDGMRFQHDHVLARIALERGAVRSALVLARHPDRPAGFWPLTLRGWTAATEIEALTLCGRRDEARALLAEQQKHPCAPMHTIDVERAAAVVAASYGSVEVAGGLLTRAATAAVSRGQFVRGRQALDQAVRYRSGLAARALLGLRGEDPATGRSQRIARAWLASDAAELELCAQDLERHQLRWRAMEVAELAAFVRGFPDSTLLRLRRTCPDLHSPVATSTGWSRLTPREQQIARLAAEGASDADVASAIGISVRTVQTHLGHAYRKLGLARRGELATVIPVDPTETQATT